MNPIDLNDTNKKGLVPMSPPPSAQQNQIGKEAVVPVKKVNPKFWQFYRVSGKTREAKFLLLPSNPETFDLFCVARTDNNTANQFQSIIISNSDNPFWNENFTLDSRVVFKVLKFTVWMASKSSNGEVVNVPIGKVVIPRKFMKAKDEQCYMLVNAFLEDKVSGSVQVQIRYRSPEETKTKHEYSVKILKAKDLACGNNSVNPYAVMFILPSDNFSQKKATHSCSKTCNPVFNEETYLFTANPEENPFQLDLHVSLWDKRGDDTPRFLGHVMIPLGPLCEIHAVKKYFTLTTLRNDEVFSEKGLRDRKAAPGTALALELVKSFAADNFPPLTERDHNFVSKSGNNIGICPGCKEIMTGQVSCCAECLAVVHVKCQEKLPTICGGFGNFRFTIDFTKFIALDLPMYDQFLDVMREDNYFALTVMGKVSNYREEVSRCLLKVFDNTYVDFLREVCKKEILDAESPQTLFRGNSIASKAVDVFMKHEGTEYLRYVLQGTLKVLNHATKNFEMDPIRLQKDADGNVVEDLKENLIFLKQCTAMVFDSIMNSVDQVPPSFKAVFSTIQETVEQKFPSNDLTRYISISGFIFLRFFTPAIFGPTLFGLKIGVQDQKSKRRFTLVAKTLQNLSNMAEFGKKEPFMEPMNVFIKSKFSEMKHFIDQISKSPVNFKPAARDLLPEEVAKDIADLVRYVALSMDKVSAFQPKTEIISVHLPNALLDVEKKIKKYDADFNGFTLGTAADPNANRLK